jgi:hypothetical protein
MKLRYEIVQESTRDQLHTKVTEMIDQGWTPLGPAQAMIVKTEIGKESKGDGSGDVISVAYAADWSWIQTMTGTFPEPGDREVEVLMPFRIKQPRVGDKIKAKGFSGIGEVLVSVDFTGYFKVRFPTGDQFIHFTRIEKYVTE